MAFAHLSGSGAEAVWRWGDENTDEGGSRGPMLCDLLSLLWPLLLFLGVTVVTFGNSGSYMLG